MEIRDAIQALLEKRNLTSDAMTTVMHAIMTGAATPAQIGGFLIGLRMKGETVDEIAAAVTVMRDLASKVTVKDKSFLVDTCGTGGDSSGTFNISTASAIVASAAGAKVAKHGNRSVTSRSGSADVLEAAGVKLELSAEQVARSIEQTGLGFMFAPMHHSAMKHAIGPRKEMGVRTIFNVLGPLTNPAGAPNQLLGVYDRSLLQPLAEVLLKLGSRHVMIVNAADGLDEISIANETYYAELKQGKITTNTIQPEDFGFVRQPLESIQVKSSADSLNLIRAAFANEPGPARDIIQLNAGAAIYVSGIANSLADGITQAQTALESGAAIKKLEQLVTTSSQL